MNIQMGLRAVALGVALVCGAPCVQAAVYSSGTYQLQRDNGGDFQDVGLSVGLTFIVPTVPAGTLWQYYAQGNVTWTSGIEAHVWWAAYPTNLYEGSEHTSLLQAWNSNGYAATPCRYIFSCHAGLISPTIDSTTPILTLGQTFGRVDWIGGSSNFSVAYNVALPDGYSLVAAPVPGPIAGSGLPALLALGGFVWARRRRAAVPAAAA